MDSVLIQLNKSGEFLRGIFNHEVTKNIFAFGSMGLGAVLLRKDWRYYKKFGKAIYEKTKNS